MLAVGITESGRQDTLTYRAHTPVGSLPHQSHQCPTKLVRQAFLLMSTPVNVDKIDISVLHENPSDDRLVKIRISFSVWCSFKAILANCNLEP